MHCVHARVCADHVGFVGTVNQEGVNLGGAAEDGYEGATKLM